MALKVKEAVDREEKERERRERATEAHFPKQQGLSTAWRAAPVVANVADAVSTEVMRRKDPERFVEQNPVMRGLVKKPLLSVAAKAALGLGSAYVADKIAKKNKTAGKLVAAGASVGPAAAATRNVVRTIKHKKR